MLNGQAMNDASLARLLGLDKQITTTTLTTLLESGVASRDEESGAVYCRRMVRDEKLRMIRSIAGSQGGNPVLLKQNKRPDLLKQNTTTGVKQNTTPSSSTSVKKRVPAVVLPDWLPESLWFDYEDMRKKKRAGMTDSIRFRIIRKLEEFHARGLDAVEALEKSVLSNWTDVYEPKGGNGHVNGNGTKPSIDEQANAHLRAALRNEGIEDSPDQAGDHAPRGGNRQGPKPGNLGDLGAKPAIVLDGKADWGL
jgi:hypothetical protein